MGYPYGDDSAFASGGRVTPSAFGHRVGLVTAEQAKRLFGIDLTEDQLTDPKFTDIVNKAQELVDKLKSTLQAIEAEKAANQLPQEPEATVSGNRIVTFTKKYDGSRCYHYVAIRPHGKKGWTISGRSAMGTDVPWAKLIQFIQKDERNPKDMLSTLRVLNPGGYIVP